MHGCEIRSESTRTIAGRSGLHPDILITASDRAPVVIEAEFMPAPEVERDAEERLRLEVTGGRREIEAAIALRYPAGLEDAYDLDAELAHAQLSYCVLTTPEEDGADFERFPESGWLQGSAADVAELARLVSVPQSTVNAAASALEAGIDSAVGVLNSMERLAPVAAREIADLLGMSDVPQTRRMACAIMANAMVFHDRIADLHSEILPLSRLWREDADNPQGRVSEAWDRILEINYWPIFAVARDIVNLLPSHAAARILEHLRTTAHRIRSTGANVAHDLTGRVFQRLIVDRKYLATFYTLPASAALLARLAVDKLEGSGLVRRRRYRQAASRRLRLRNGRAPVRRVRAICHATRAGGRRPGVAPHGDDGGCPLRLRCDALRHTHHQLHPLWQRAASRIWQNTALHGALRTLGR